MEYRTIDGVNHITKISKHEILGLLKIDCPLAFVFYSKINTKRVLGSIKISNYQVKNREANYFVTVSEDRSNPFTKLKNITMGDYWVEFDVLLSLIARIKEIGLLSIQIEKENFVMKLPLIELFDTISEPMMASLIRLEHKENLYHFEMHSKTKSPNDLFFWTKTKDLFIFNDEGPKITYGAKNITDVKTLLKMLS